MEFQIQSIMLLDQLRKSLTKKMQLRVPIWDVDESFVTFLQENVKTHPGNTDLILQIVDEADSMVTKLKSHNQKLEINDDLLEFLKTRSDIHYSLEVA
jgi:hypothetical protein